MFDLTNKRVLVTGSTQGIGYAIARALIGCGAEVYVHCLEDEEKARRVAEELSCGLWVVGDLGNPDGVRKIREMTGELDIVIANASVQIRRRWENITSEEFEKQINVNLRSTLELMQAYIPAMQNRGFGRFITVGSVQQYRPHKDMAVYAASKCAIESLVKNVAKQVAADGVTVNNIAPGVISTPRNEEALSDSAYTEKVLGGIPMGFVGNADDCAGAAVFLCSEESRYVTGTTIDIDGGMKL